jgi:hypothetical protein
MKKIFAFLLALLLTTSCAGLGLQTQDSSIAELEAKIKVLQERLDDLEMMGAAGVGANFYPARGLATAGAGSSAGDLDHITGTGNNDFGLVALLEDGTYGDAVFHYILDATGGSGDSIPFYCAAKDAGTERWRLMNVYADELRTPQKATGDFFRLYEGSGGGTDYIEGKADNDVGTNRKLVYSTSVANSEDIELIFGNNDNTFRFGTSTGVSEFDFASEDEMNLIGGVKDIPDADGETLDKNELYGSVVVESGDLQTIVLREIVASGATSTQVEPGAHFCVIVDGADGSASVRVDPDAADHIEYGGTVMANGEYIYNDSDEKGDFMCFYAMDDTTWILMGYRGTVAEETP